MTLLLSAVQSGAMRRQLVHDGINTPMCIAAPAGRCSDPCQRVRDPAVYGVTHRRGAGIVGLFPPGCTIVFKKKIFTYVN